MDQPIFDDDDSSGGWTHDRGSNHSPKDGYEELDAGVLEDVAFVFDDKPMDLGVGFFENDQVVEDDSDGGIVGLMNRFDGITWLFLDDRFVINEQFLSEIGKITKGWEQVDWSPTLMTNEQDVFTISPSSVTIANKGEGDKIVLEDCFLLLNSDCPKDGPIRSTLTMFLIMVVDYLRTVACEDLLSKMESINEKAEDEMDAGQFKKEQFFGLVFFRRFEFIRHLMITCSAFAWQWETSFQRFAPFSEILASHDLCFTSWNSEGRYALSEREDNVNMGDFHGEVTHGHDVTSLNLRDEHTTVCSRVFLSFFFWITSTLFFALLNRYRKVEKEIAKCEYLTSPYDGKLIELR